MLTAATSDFTHQATDHLDTAAPARHALSACVPCVRSSRPHRHGYNHDCGYGYVYGYDYDDADGYDDLHNEDEDEEDEEEEGGRV